MKSISLVDAHISTASSEGIWLQEGPHLWKDVGKHEDEEVKCIPHTKCYKKHSTNHRSVDDCLHLLTWYTVHAVAHLRNMAQKIA